MTRWTFIALALLTSCAANSNRKSADYPDDVDSDVPETSESKSSPVDETADAKGDDQKGVKVTGGRDDAKTGTASGAGDSVAVLQAVIDDEALEPYLHLDKPGRFPLVVAGSGIPDGLTKSSQPVKMGTEADGGKDKAVLVFTEISVSATEATVRYRYDVEGVKGSCTLVKRDGRWEIKNSRVTQH